jgi:hypothetical protein
VPLPAAATEHGRRCQCVDAAITLQELHGRDTHTLGPGACGAAVAEARFVAAPAPGCDSTLTAVTMGEMSRHVADAGSYVPVTILIQEMPEGLTRIAYDTVTSAIAPYHDAAASKVAERLDAEVLDLLRRVTGAPASATT